MSPEFNFVKISGTSTPKNKKYLQDVIALWRSHSSRLGELPEEGKILAYLSKQKLIVAVSKAKKGVAYVMFREKEQAARILHVCVQKEYRNRGLARDLVERVIHDLSHLYELKVSCRRDYELNDFWSSLGFTAMSDRSGRNVSNHLITEWVLNYGKPNLLTLLHEQITNSKLCAVIDTNIFLDLTEENPDRNTEDSKVLASDSLYTDTEFLLASEIYNDINRISSNQERSRRREKIGLYKVIAPSREKVNKVRSQLRKYFPSTLTPQDNSDLMHLATAIANDCHCFITRDSELLKLDPKIYNQFGIPILRPSDFMIYIDELLQASKYQPSRLSNTSIQVNNIGPGEQEIITQQFLNFQCGERKSEFRKTLRECISDIGRFQCQVLTDTDINKIVAFYVIDRETPNELRIPILRLLESSSFKKSLSRHLAFRFVRTAVSENRYFIKISDPNISASVKEALLAERFILQNESYVKCAFPLLDEARKLPNKVDEMLHSLDRESSYSFCRDIISYLARSNSNKELNSIIEVEKTFHPIKILNADIPNYIIPIQPRWAEELIDEDLASLLILGANKELTLRREMIYYRASKPGIVSAPARILWYVSESKHGRQFPNTKSIKACSVLDEVIVDKAESIYMQFRRYGIYRREDVFGISRDGLEGEIMAIRFSDTQLANKPIPYSRILDILSPKKPPLIAPYKIPEEAFSEFYREGFLK